MIIGLSGKAGSGKDSLAFALQSMFGFQRAAFADNLKEAAATILGLSKTQMRDREMKEAIDPRWNMSPRTMLQKIGVAMRETINPDVWVKSLFESTIAKSPIADWVVTDVRFPNEANAIKEAGGFMVRIERPGAGLRGESAQHVSETALDSYDFNAKVYNSGNIRDLESCASELFLAFLDPDRRDNKLVFSPEGTHNQISVEDL